MAPEEVSDARDDLAADTLPDVRLICTRAHADRLLALCKAHSALQGRSFDVYTERGPDNDVSLYGPFVPCARLGLTLAALGYRVVECREL